MWNLYVLDLNFFQFFFLRFSPFERYKKRVSQPKPFKPHYVEHDRKCLSFQGYFKQEISPDDREKRLFRKITMIYYLEDDTMTIFEPPVAVRTLTMEHLLLTWRKLYAKFFSAEFRLSARSISQTRTYSKICKIWRQMALEKFKRRHWREDLRYRLSFE